MTDRIDEDSALSKSDFLGEESVLIEAISYGITATFASIMSHQGPRDRERERERERVDA